MTTICSATSIASSWSCVTKIVVTWISSCSRRSHSRSSARTCASSAPKGSSSSSTSGCGRQRARERHALQLAAGELRGVALGEAVEPHEREQLVARARRISAFGRLRTRQAEGDVVVHGHVLERGVVLEDEAHAARARGRVGHVLLRRSARCPLSGRLQPRDDAQQRRLAAAARAEQRRQRAVAARSR